MKIREGSWFNKKRDPCNPRNPREIKHRDTSQAQAKQVPSVNLLFPYGHRTSFLCETKSVTIRERKGKKSKQGFLAPNALYYSAIRCIFAVSNAKSLRFLHFSVLSHAFMRFSHDLGFRTHNRTQCVYIGNFCNTKIDYIYYFFTCL